MSNKSFNDHLQEFLQDEIPYRVEKQFEIPKEEIPENFVQDCLERLDINDSIMIAIGAVVDATIEIMLETYELTPEESEETV